MSGLDRWRLVLGEASHGRLGQCDCDQKSMESALSWLYDRDETLANRGIMTREGGRGGSTLSTVEWIEKIHQLFPKETIERLEQDAVETFQIDDLVTNLEVLQRVEPNQTLLKAVLRTKHLMNQEVLAMARQLVRQVVEELLRKLKSEFRRSFSGALDRRRSSPVKSARNFDFQRTLKRNLKNFDGQKVVIERAYFHSRVKRHIDNWQVILLVDQSGSMLDSVIHAALTASCLWDLPGIRSHLCIFDTQVVDLTEQCSDPVETLMKTQLGGGTDIGKAVTYGGRLVSSPRKAVVVVITDFFEGGSPQRLVREVARLCAEGTTVLGLAALDQEATPTYDRDLAGKLVDVGAQVGAMTPGELASWLAEKLR
jgi:uncharacterized protein with von Willebrand factor type A (vWA) domain